MILERYEVELRKCSMFMGQQLVRVTTSLSRDNPMQRELLGRWESGEHGGNTYL